MVAIGDDDGRLLVGTVETVYSVEKRDLLG